MNRNEPKHNIILTGRSSISVDGVTEVISYDENNIVMETNMGQLTLDGTALNIVKLNLEDGEVAVDGRIDALYYIEQSGKRSLFSRLFG